MLVYVIIEKLTFIFISCAVWIALYCELDSKFCGDVELHESYFGTHLVMGRRLRRAYGKTIVFGLYKRVGEVFTKIVSNCKSKTIQDIIIGVSVESVIHSDGWQ